MRKVLPAGQIHKLGEKKVSEKAYGDTEKA